ncbi:MAG TPA: FAD-dependent oxidoreductase [Deltaproteobacteria bacterium]|nr:FAD-dependent oxidoreductase [Deltaproteobacteria bacterium]
MTKKIGTAMVVGAGISGIRTALDLAETGYGVTLIDKAPHIGGVLSQLDYQFPTDHCGMCKMLPLVDRDASSQYCLRKGLFHENIDILLSTELISVSGEPGNFEVTLRQKPSWVDPKLCIGCGACEDLCPVEVPDDFNKGLTNRKAVYLPVPHAIPNTYVIDTAACTRCGACEPVCPTGAIQLSQQERKKFRILVVDDELIVRDSLKEILDEEGYTVEMAESGPAALEALSRQPYQLMLLDIKMPGMDGVEVLQKAKEMNPDLSVVMMTAYATVETAVEAMKIGALEYLIKPFETDALIPMVLSIYEDFEVAKARKMEVGALALCGGTAYFDPKDGKNTFGYGALPNVVTSIEFERICSGTGPFNGRMVRPSDGKPIGKIAWIQCVGSRDLQLDSDYCSNICCMYAVKEALLAKKKTNGEIEPVIFYMDMRTFGKTFQRYRDQAESVHGVRFERGRIHSIIPDQKSGDLILLYADSSGKRQEENFDMVVLAVGQRPTPETKGLAEQVGIELNSWGFAQTAPFSLTQTSKNGIVIGGSFSGLKDIGESVIQASAAAANASRVIHSTGGGLALQPSLPSLNTDILRENPKILVALCTCGESLSRIVENADFTKELLRDPAVNRVETIAQTCTEQGWERLKELVEAHKPNRLLIGACLPYLYARKIRELGRQVNLDPSLMDVVEIRPRKFAQKTELKAESSKLKVQRDLSAFSFQLSALKMGVAKLKRMDPSPVETIKIQQRALIVGGGIAGMTAALTIAEHGFQVDLVELSEQLGGNLSWIQKTLEGHAVQPLLEETVQKVEKHPLVNVHTQSHVVTTFGQVGNFFTTIEHAENGLQTLTHGIAILATGGTEAGTTSYGHGTSEAILTQKELEGRLSEASIDPVSLKTVVMIQCVDSREEPRNYCSRVCCGNALKQALHLKEKHPDIAIYVLYRDMMSYGFTETYYTRARKAGVFFIQYNKDNKPDVEPEGGMVRVTVDELIIGKKVTIEADLVVLATGIQPNFPKDLADGFGAGIDPDGFFQEAESKWRPVDALNEGIFSCGIAHSPRSIAESIATAEAAAQRSLRILTKEHLRSGKVAAKVKHSICSRCERCVEACPYGARKFDIETEKLEVNAVRCQGCGSCAVACPNGASFLEGFPDQQMLEVIDAAMVGT